jgi:PhnB protein
MGIRLREEANAARSGNMAKILIQPWFTIPDAEAALDFYEAAFGARIVYRLEEIRPDVVARLAVGDAEFWVSSGEREGDLGGKTVRMILVVDEPEAMFEQAIAAGATEVAPVGESHGWKLGRLTDPFGLDWEVGYQLTE